MSNIHLIVADHYPIVRKGLHMLFEVQPDIDIVAETDHVAAALSLVQQMNPEILLLEMQLPGNGARYVLDQLRRSTASTSVLVLSTENDEKSAAQMMQLGAKGYVSKTCDTTEIIEAVRKIIDGGLFISAELAQRIAISSLSAEPRVSALDLLSGRERQVLAALASGLSVNNVAARLHLSPKTVSTHKARISQKLGVRSTFELMRYAMTLPLGKL